MKVLTSGIAIMIVATLTGCDAASDAATEVQGDFVDSQMNNLAQEQIEVYEIAKKNGDTMQTCAQAMAIAQIFLQSKDEANWKSWKEKEKADCEAAGMPVS